MNKQPVFSDEDASKLTGLLVDLKCSYLPDQLLISLLEDAIEGAEILPSDSLPPDVVRLDATVHVLDLQTGKKKRYTVVSPEFADITKRLLSVTAPLGIALLGHKQGEVVEAKAPGGVRMLEITWVRQPPQRADDRNAPFSKHRASRLNLNPVLTT